MKIPALPLSQYLLLSSGFIAWAALAVAIFVGNAWVFAGFFIALVSCLWCLKIMRRGIVVLLLLGFVSIQFLVQAFVRQTVLDDLSATQKLQVEVTEYQKHKQSLRGENAWVVGKVTGVPFGPSVRVWLKHDKKNIQNLVPSTVISVTGRIEKQPFTAPEALTISATATPNILRKPAPIWQQLGNMRTQIKYVAAAVNSQLLAKPKDNADTENITDTSALPQLLASGAQLVPGFTVGDTGGVSDADMEKLRAAGLLHLTAVSGGNCAIIIGAIAWLCKITGIPRLVRPLLQLAALAAFAAAVGPDSSLQRAAIMCTVILLGRFGSLQGVGFAALGLAMLVLLACDPWQAIRPGFALSVTATLGILLFTSAISRMFERCRLPVWLRLPLAVTIAAQIGCAPWLLLLQDNLPVAGIAANLLAAPIAPVATGFGLLTYLALPLHAPTAGILFALATACCALIKWFADSVLLLPLTELNWPAGADGAAQLLTCYIMFWFALQLYRGKLRLPYATLQKTPWGMGAKPKVAGTLLVVMPFLSGTAIILGHTTLNPVLSSAAIPRDWIVAGCDVGQGDAFLVRGSANEKSVILVDTGDNPQKLETCLNKLGVSNIALLVLTHDDRDHVGALSVAALRSAAILIAPPTTAKERPLIKEIDQYATPTAIGIKGMQGKAAGVHWQVLAPEKSFTSQDTNAMSLIMHFQIDQMTALFMGDTGQKEQAKLMQNTPPELLDIDILKVAHHGSRDQEEKLFAAQTPTWSLIGVGLDNTYGHPTKTTLDNLRRVGSKILRTDQNGTIIITADGRAWVAQNPEN